MTDATAPLTIDHFTPHIGKVFGVADAPEQPGLTLLEATPLTMKGGDPSRRAPFSLTFSADAAEPQQGTQILDIPGVGETPVFLVPVRLDDGRIVFEAVFS